MPPPDKHAAGLTLSLQLQCRTARSEQLICRIVSRAEPMAGGVYGRS